MYFGACYKAVAVGAWASGNGCDNVVAASAKVESTLPEMVKLKYKRYRWVGNKVKIWYTLSSLVNRGFVWRCRGVGPLTKRRHFCNHSQAHKERYKKTAIEISVELVSQYIQWLPDRGHCDFIVELIDPKCTPNFELRFMTINDWSLRDSSWEPPELLQFQNKKKKKKMKESYRLRFQNSWVIKTLRCHEQIVMSTSTSWTFLQPPALTSNCQLLFIDAFAISFRALPLSGIHTTWAIRAIASRRNLHSKMESPQFRPTFPI